MINTAPTPTRNGRPLKPCTLKLLSQLTPEEHEVYGDLVAPTLRGHRRIEQERISLQVALCAIRGVVTLPSKMDIEWRVSRRLRGLEVGAVARRIGFHTRACLS
ncbi:Wadjet anti-phage system protein JetD domain-containing protein [Nocardia sp. Marseille-Q1738]